MIFQLGSTYSSRSRYSSNLLVFPLLIYYYDARFLIAKLASEYRPSNSLAGMEVTIYFFYILWNSLAGSGIFFDVRVSLCWINVTL